MTSLILHEHETPEHPSTSYSAKELSNKRKRPECSNGENVVIDEDQSLLNASAVSPQSEGPIPSRLNGDAAILMDEEFTCNEDVIFEEKVDKENLKGLQRALEQRVSKRHKLRVDAPIPASFASVDEMLKPCDDELLRLMMAREEGYQPLPDYVKSQPEIDHTMRAILIDWMMEVGQEFLLTRETVQLAINYVDRYLSAMPNINRGQLQLLGLTSLFVAAKLEEMTCSKASDFAVTTDGAYTVPQLHVMERELLKTLSWRLLAQTPIAFVKIFIKYMVVELHQLDLSGNFNPSNFDNASVSQLIFALLSTDNFTRCMEYIDMVLLDFNHLQFYPSCIAAAALCICIPQLANMMPLLFGFQVDVLQSCIDYVHNFTVINHRPLQHPPPSFFSVKAPSQELYLRQLHHPGAIPLYKELRP